MGCGRKDISFQMYTGNYLLILHLVPSDPFHCVFHIYPFCFLLFQYYLQYHSEAPFSKFANYFKIIEVHFEWL